MTLPRAPNPGQERAAPPRPALPRRDMAVSVLRALLTTSALVWLYFEVPLDGRLPASGLLLALALVAFTALLGWQTRSIVLSREPRLRALEVVATAAPLFLLLFASSYYLIERNQPGSFSEPLSRLDALYFTITVFATVGFGDIVAKTETARGVVTVQMIGNLAFIGLGVRMLLSAVQLGLQRRDLPSPPPADAPPPGDQGEKPTSAPGRVGSSP